MVGDMISVIDMPPPQESVWWRGKRGFQVGFFPYECVQVIGDKVPTALHPPGLSISGGRVIQPAPSPPPHHCAPAPTKPVLRKHGKLIAFFRSFILSRPSRRKLKRQGILRERVFGCDLGEHLLNSGHDLPMVLRCCAEFIESHGTVDGIYRLSGITSNIQKLRNAFDEDRIPDLYGDESILQDIHCVSSVLKMYFRELPNPLLTYQLYERFVAAVTQDEGHRLIHVRDVVQQLPPPHYRTLRYLVQHLSRVACHSPDTGMTPKNIAIVWAPNLLRCKHLEEGGVAALQDVGTQAVVTEYLIRYVDMIFSDKLPVMPQPAMEGGGTPKRGRPKSLAISTPAKLLSIEEARIRALTTAIKPDQKYIEVGGGPQSLPKTYHTVIELPSRKGGSLKQKKSPLGWKSLFSKGRAAPKQQRKISTPSELNFSAPACSGGPAEVGGGRGDGLLLLGGGGAGRRLRPVKSEESLASTPASHGGSNRSSQLMSTPEHSGDSHQDKSEGIHETGAGTRIDSGPDSGSSPLPSPRTHNRSVSHDSYFNLLEGGERGRSPREGVVAEEGESDLELSPESSKLFLDISELNIDFNTSEPEMKIFSEDETLKSTSVEESLSRSTLDMENLSMGSGSARSKENITHRFEKRSLKDKLRHKFTSPSLPRKSGGEQCKENSEESTNVKRASIAVKNKFVNALSPEISRSRYDSPQSVGSSCSSPAMTGDHLTSSHSLSIATDPASTNSTAHDQDALLSSPLLDSSGLDKDTSATESECHASEDTRSERSFESALIDPELMAKLTKLRSSPSVTASEASSASLAEATVSDNESFTLGSSGSNGAGAYTTNSTEGKGLPLTDAGNTPEDPTAADRKGTLDLQSRTQEFLAPGSPVVSIMSESCPGPLDIKGSSNTREPDTESIGESKSECTDTVRPTSLLGIPAVGVSTARHSGTSPETPQGDSTFLEIQYHPLSDTTEPSTPSESHFIEEAAGPESTTPVARPAACFPVRGARLSPDLSSSSADDPIENVPIYENVEATSTGLLMSGGMEGRDSVTPSADLQMDYENVSYSNPYENVGDVTMEQKVQLTDTIIRKKSLSKKMKKKSPSRELAPSDEQHRNESSLIASNTYENVFPSSPNNKVGLLETALDDDYEMYQFHNLSTQPAKAAAEESQAPALDCSDDIRAVEIDGEIVYQQVKYLRKSIQEINDLIDSDTSSAVVAESTSVLQVVEGSPAPSCPEQGDSSVLGSTKVTAGAHTEDSECLDSPVTPSSSSLQLTEVLVMPSFSSPTESTTDDMTSSDASEPPSSTHAHQPSSIHNQQTSTHTQQPTTTLSQTPPSTLPQHCPTSNHGAVVVPSLSPPTPPESSTAGREIAPPLSPSAPATALTTILSPTPWPRTAAPRPNAPLCTSLPSNRPRVLPHLSLGSPVPSSSSSTSPISHSNLSPNSGSVTASIPSSTDGTPTEDTVPCLAEAVAPFTSQANNNGPAVPAATALESPLHDTNVSNDESTSGFHDNDEPHAVDFKQRSPKSTNSVTIVSINSKLFGDRDDVTIPMLPHTQPLQRHKTSPDIMKSEVMHDRVSPQSKEAEDLPAKAKSDPGQSADIAIALNAEDDPTKRERIEKYKEERRTFLREKYKSESFRGEKDEMLLRLKQKATSPSRLEDEETLTEDRSLDQTAEDDRLRLGQRDSRKEGADSSHQDRTADHRTGLIATSFLSDCHVENQQNGKTNSHVSQFAKSSASTHPPRKTSKQDLPMGSAVEPHSSLKGESGDRPPCVTQRKRSIEKLATDKTVIRTPSGSMKQTKQDQTQEPFRRSSSIKLGTDRRKSATKTSEIDDDINVKEIIAVWDKDVVTQQESKVLKSPGERSSALSAKFETGLFYGSSKNLKQCQKQEATTNISRRLDRVVSHDPSIESADSVSFVNKLNRGVSADDSIAATKPKNIRAITPKESPAKRRFIAKGDTSALEGLSSPGKLYKNNVEKKPDPAESIASHSYSNNSDRSYNISVSSSAVGGPFASSSALKTVPSERSTGGSSLHLSNPMSSKTGQLSAGGNGFSSNISTSKLPPHPVVVSASSKSSSVPGSRTANSLVSGRTAPPILTKPSAVSQQRKIKDMAAMFEGPHSASSP